MILADAMWDVDVDEMRCDEWRLTMMTSRAMGPF